MPLLKKYYQHLMVPFIVVALSTCNMSNDSTGPSLSEHEKCPACPLLQLIPQGSFQMGSLSPNADNDEIPQHQITISKPFAVGKYEVTRGEYAAFVKATNHSTNNACNVLENKNWILKKGVNWQNPGYPQTDRDPVVCVSWQDTQAYLAWLSKVTKQKFRLLTEAEWEYIARGKANTDTAINHNITINHNMANYGVEGDCCGPFKDGLDIWDYTAPVGSFAADSYGVHDIRGNVWEWLEDCYHKNYINAPTDGTARTEGCSLSDRRVVRGGSWGDAQRFLHPAYRLRAPLDMNYFTLGFRVASGPFVKFGN